MGRFNNSTSQDIDFVTGPHLEYGDTQDFWISLWRKRTEGSSIIEIFHIAGASSRQLFIEKSSGGNIRFEHDEGATTKTVDFASNANDDEVWHNLQCGRIGSAIFAYTDGVFSNTDATITPNEITSVSVFDRELVRGTSGEYAMWIGSIPDERERILLAHGRSPMAIKRRSLRLYNRLKGDLNPEPDLAGFHSDATVETPSSQVKTDHPFVDEPPVPLRADAFFGLIPQGGAPPVGGDAVRSHVPMVIG